MPILAVLMFLIGTELRQTSFKEIIRTPIPILIGLIGQLLILPLIALFLGCLLDLNPLYFTGLMLIALSPGGSSSNVFTLLVKGNVELSVLLTLLSSIITIITLPIAMNLISHNLLSDTRIVVDMIGEKILLQNILLTIIPILLGIVLRIIYPNMIHNVSKVLHKIVLPSLLVLVLLFIIQHFREIYDNILELGSAVAGLITIAMLCSTMLSRLCKLSIPIKRTIVIEVGMQNAAQAIAIATSPLIFNNEQIALPAVIYTLFMNVILLSYVMLCNQKQLER